jgi:hypothetical protein
VQKKKGGELLTASIQNQKVPVSILLDRLFFHALIAEPHHAANFTARGHHFCRLHGFSAALGNVQVYNGLFGGRFCGLTHFCHGTITSGLISRKPLHFIHMEKNVKTILSFSGGLPEKAGSGPINSLTIGGV